MSNIIAPTQFQEKTLEQLNDLYKVFLFDSPNNMPVWTSLGNIKLNIEEILDEINNRLDEINNRLDEIEEYFNNCECTTTTTTPATPDYLLTIQPQEGVLSVTGTGYYHEGEVVNIEAFLESGYEFDKFVVLSGNPYEINRNPATYYMGAFSVTINAYAKRATGPSTTTPDPDATTTPTPDP